MDTKEFFSEYGDIGRYTIKEIIGKGSYGVVCSAVDNTNNEKVAIKRINNVFDHVSDATRILREIKLLRLLRHPGKYFVCPDRQFKKYIEYLFIVCLHFLVFKDSHVVFCIQFSKVGRYLTKVTVLWISTVS